MAMAAPLPPICSDSINPRFGQQEQALPAHGLNARAAPITHHTLPPPTVTPIQQSHTQVSHSPKSPPADGGSGAPPPLPVAPALALASILPPDPYRNPEPLEGCSERPTINRYKFAKLGAEHLARIHGLENALRVAVKDSKVKKRNRKFSTMELSHYRDLITFEFMVCGPSSAQAQPSVIAFCPLKILPLLKIELRRSGTHLQYAGSKFGPCFELYYCVREGLAYYRTWCTKAVTFLGSTAQDASEDPEYLPKSPTMCGARINCAEPGMENLLRSATLTCVLKVKGDLFGLTSAHPFCNEDNLNSQEKLLEQLSQFDDDDENCEISFEDEEGDLSGGSSGSAEEIVGHTMSSLLEASTPRLGTADDLSTRTNSAEESSVIFPGPGDLGSDENDCDWAMIPIKWTGQRLPNAYPRESSSTRLRYVTEFACEHPVTETPVQILTSSSIKYGTLLPGSASLSGLSGRGHCTVLVVSMKGSDGIVKGDSGSLVVDESSKAYGHVVATSPQGDAYIVPLHETLRQIRALFETIDVGLPNPLQLLTEAALFYIKSKQPRAAKAAITELAALVQQLCNAQKWHQVAHWAATSAPRSTLVSMSDGELAEVFYEFDDQRHVKQQLQSLMMGCSSHPLHSGLLKSIKRLERLATGGFGTVYRIKILDTYRTTWGKNGETQFALKMTPKKITPLSQWLNERSVLRQLDKFNHPHIIKLLASYRTEDYYHLVFPLAQCDLDYLMTSNGSASQTQSKWVLEQVKGLAEALEYLHTGNERNAYYGTHGDIKPENILVFSQDMKRDARNESTSGTLVIADFGLSEFRPKPSRELCVSNAVYGDYPSHYRAKADRQYAAPEIEVHTDRRSDGRAFDIWALGCVLLELLVWVIDGAESRQQMMKQLHPDAPGHAAPYWHIETTTQSMAFSVKSQVTTRLQSILDRTKDNAKLQAAIHLLVYGGLLDPDPNIRPTAKELGRMLIEIQSGVAIEQRNVTNALPVWERSWIQQFPQSHRPSLPIAQLEASGTTESQMTSATTASLPLLDEEEKPGISRSPSNFLDDYDEEVAPKQTCPYCKIIGRPVALKPHLRAQHRRHQPQVCTECGYLFGDKQQLSRHQRGLELHNSFNPTSYTSSANDPGNQSTTQYMTPLQPPTSSNIDKKSTEVNSGLESTQPHLSNSYALSFYGIEQLPPGSGPTKLRSGGVKRYAPNCVPLVE